MNKPTNPFIKAVGSMYEIYDRDWLYGVASTLEEAQNVLRELKDSLKLTR